MSAGRWAALGALGLLAAGCRAPHAPAPGKPTIESAPPGAATARAPASDPTGREQFPVLEPVAKLHDVAFEPTPADAENGPLICLVTLHDAALRQGHFYPLFLYAGGTVATWRQTATGSAQEPFFAKLSAEEQARASELIAAIPQGRSLARKTFDASALVMGVSTRVGGRAETLYFDNERIPAALGQLVGMLKHRLEETNRGEASRETR